MATSLTPDAEVDPKVLVQRALVANQQLQRYLTQRAGELEAELAEADKLLEQLEINEVDDEIEDEIHVPGASRPAGFFLPKEYLDSESPFREDALARNEYAARITPRSMNPKELEVLKASVRAENMRLQACRAQAGITTPIDLDKNVEGIDWGTVAERVSDVSTYKYSSEECRIRWIGDQHPSINHSDWTSSEHKTLAELADSARKSNPNGRVDWVEIAKQLGTNRTPLAVMSKSVARTRHTWDAKSDRALLESVDIYGINNWMSVAQHVSPHATHTQCQGRYYKSLDPSIKRGAWTPEEDARLTKLVASLGSAWVKVAEFMPGRTNDQCHERWTEGMNSSSSKNVWTEEEDRRLKELVASMGNSWKAISTQIGNGKTGPSCRARFTKLSKSTTPTAASTLALMDGDQPTTTTGQSSPSAPLVQPVGSMLAEPSGSNQESSTSAKKRREDAPVAPAAKRRKIAPGSSEEPSAESDAMTPKPTPGSKPRPRPRPTTTVAKK